MPLKNEFVYNVKTTTKELTFKKISCWRKISVKELLVHAVENYRERMTAGNKIV
jgi:hypothetical protein